MKPLLALLWAKRRMMRHWIASARHESKLKIVIVSVAAALLWVGIFEGSRFAFGLLEILGSEMLPGGRLSLSDLVMSRLLSVFSLALLLMLTTSNMLIAYTTMFRSNEMQLLLHSPMPIAQVFLGRLYECVTFSSWASAYLGLPLLVAYGIESSASPLFYVAIVLFYIPFVTIPAAIGTAITIVVVRFIAPLRLGRGGKQGGSAAVPIALALIVAIFVYFRTGAAQPTLDEATSVPAIVEVMGHTQSPYLPSQWLALGLSSAAQGGRAAFESTVFNLLLLIANAAFLVWLATLAAEAWLYDGWAELGGGAGSGKQRGWRPRFGSLERILGLLSPPTRALVIKDLRLFWREPAQWSQFLLLFGIMAIYLANLQDPASSGESDTMAATRTMLNIAAAMLVLAALTTRFIYPLISLEGRRIWILGLAPIGFGKIVWQKFLLSVATTSVFTVGLAVLSAVQLDIDRFSFALSVFGTSLATIALSGLAVGLGSLYATFDEDNPSRIVSGMGGTLSFLTSMIYVVLMILSLAVVLFSRTPTLESLASAWLTPVLVVWIVVLSAVTCALPLRLGLKNLERAEF